MKLQEIFDVVAVHLLTQNRQALDELGHCRYRAQDPETGETLRCAVGRLIPDRSYHISLEGEPVRDSLVRDKLGLIATEENAIKLLARLQGVHDTSDVEDWRSHLTDVAYDFELSSSIIDKQGGDEWNRMLQWSPDATERASKSESASSSKLTERAISETSL